MSPDTALYVSSNLTLQQMLPPLEQWADCTVGSAITPLVTASPQASLLELAQKMAVEQVGAVVIVEESVPIGMITERDLVQFQASCLDFAQVQAIASLRSVPLLVNSQETLWTVYRTLQQQQVEHAVVVAADGTLVGMVTQTQLLRSLNPLDLCQALETLNHTVDQLQEQQQRLTTERDQALQTLTERDRLLQQKQQAEASLSSHEAQLNALIENLPFAVWAKDRQGCLLIQNPQCQKLWHDSIGETIQGSEDWLPPGIWQTWQQENTRVYAGEVVKTEEVWTIDQEPRTFSKILAPIRTGDAIEGLLGVAIDITEQKQAEEALRQSECLLRQLVDHVDAAFWMTTTDHQTLYVSPRYEELWGQSCAEQYADDSAYLRAVHPDDQAIAETAFHNLEQQDSYQVEYRIILPDGRVRWICDRAFLIHDEEGNPSRYAGFSQDISIRKQLELALQASEERWQLAIQANNDGIWDWNVSTNEISYYARWKTMLGYTDEEIEDCYESWRSRVHPDDYEEVMRQADAYFQKQLSHYAVEYRLRAKDGSYRWILARAQACWDQQGHVTRVVGSHSDITQRKQLELELRNSEAQLRDVLSHAHAAIARFRVYARNIWHYDYFSAGCERVFGYTPEELIGDPHLWSSRVLQEDWESVILPTFEVILAEKSHTYEYRFHHKDGSLRWIGVNLTSQKDKDSQCWQVTVVETDISDRKRIEANLAVREAAARENEQFLRSIYEGSALSIFVVDVLKDDVLKDGSFQFVGFNPVHERLTGLKTEAIRGRCPADLFPPHTAAEVQQHYQECLEGGKAIAYEESLTFFNEPSWWLTTLTPLKDANGSVYRLIGTSINIGDRKLTEEALWQQAQRDQILNQVVQTIRNSLNLEQVFSATASLLAQLLQVEWVQIVQHHPELGIWRVIYEYRPNLALPSKLGMEIPDAGNALAVQLKQMEPVQVEDTETLNDPVNQELAQQYPGSWLLMPVPDLSDRTRQRVYGSLSLLRYQQTGPWDDWDVELVQSIADQVAIAIQQANLYEKAQSELRERQRAEAELQQLNRELERRVQERTQQLRLAIATAKMGTWEWDMETNVQRWSPENYLLLGYQTDEQGRVLDQNGTEVSPEPSREVFLSRVHPDDVEATVLAGKRAIENPQDFYETEQRIVWHDGTLRWRYSRGACILNGQGQAIGLVGISMDVTDRKRENEALRQSESRYERLAANVPGIIYQYLLRGDGSDAFTYVSPQCYNIFELNPEDLIQDANAAWSLIHADQINELRATILDSAQTLNPWYAEFRITTASGKTKWLKAASVPDQRGDLEVIWDGLIMDISEGKQAELQLQKRAEADQLLAAISQTVNQSFQLDEVLDELLKRIRSFLQVDRVIVYRFQPDGSGVIEKEAASAQLSIRGQVMMDPCFNQGVAMQYQEGYVTVLNDRQKDPIAPCYSEMLAQIQVEANLVVPILQAENLWGLLLVHQCHKPRHWEQFEVDLLQRVGLQLGIAGQKAALYSQVRAELRQKELLLKEVHHRVKNNLQVISSLLRMQARATEAPGVQAALTDSESRVRAIALIHENLYQSHDLERLEFHDYIRRLATAILAAHTTPPNLITLTFDLEPVFLNLETAIPCGILLNELVTNALKHAFPDGRLGTIHITLKQLPAVAPALLPSSPFLPRQTPPAPRYQLTVQDNGVGIPTDRDLNNLRSLGIQISYDLALQLRGTLELDNLDGTRFQLTFSELTYRRRL